MRGSLKNGSIWAAAFLVLLVVALVKGELLAVITCLLALAAALARWLADRRHLQDDYEAKRSKGREP